jgi:two-component system chemotaxis sensor kinase CheA
MLPIVIPAQAEIQAVDPAMSEPAADILSDFLTEAGEILAQLNEQLPALEQAPEDRELLNAVFRGFHTIKGGAGFIGATEMVELCHRAEDVFNLLRQGTRTADLRTMDATLQVLDCLGAMFDALGVGQALTSAPPELLEELGALAEAPSAGRAQASSHVVTASANAVPKQSDPPGDITDEEFEALLDAAQARAMQPADAEVQQSAAGAAKSTNQEIITEDEFEALLDQLHGAGKGPAGQTVAPQAATKLQASATGSKDPTSATTSIMSKPAARSESRNAPSASQSSAQPDNTVRVDTRRLDDLMNLVGELVLVRNRLSSMQGLNTDEELGKTISSLDVVTSGLQAAVMKARMQPIKKLFSRFPRVIRDLARTLQKEVELELFGQETDLDKNLVEALADPLVHLLRNAVDHGIEMPEARAAAGKPRAGRILLGARQEGDRILLVVEDDGKGMDPELLRRKAVEKGVITAEAAARMSDVESFELIFAAGFSTKSEISEVSGRGVGMDVVKSRIAQLNGSVDITSEPGQGSSICVKLPLTLAILPTLMVVVSGRRFALPLSAVEEILDLAPGATHWVDGQELAMVRDKPLPVFRLRRWLARGTNGAGVQDMHLVVVQAGSQRVGFVVDQLIGREEVVIKPLGAFLHGLPGIAGATITGDGRLALILDAIGLVKSCARAA